MKEKETESGSSSQREGPDAIALTLRRARQELGLTTREVAARIGVSPAFITLIETGRKRPGSETARALARVLGLPEAPLLAWVELGRGYERKSRATEVIAHYLSKVKGQRLPEQAKPGSRALLMMSRLLGAPPSGPEGAEVSEIFGARSRETRSRMTAGTPLPHDALFMEGRAAGELIAKSSSDLGRGLLPVPLLAEGADPGTPGASPIDWVVLDRALLPSGVPMEEAWAYRISAAGARNAPDSLAAGDVVVLTRHGWPVASGEVYALWFHDRIELGRVAVKGDALVVLLAEGVELLRLPTPDAPPPELRGRVVLVVRGSRRGIS